MTDRKKPRRKPYNARRSKTSSRMEAHSRDLSGSRLRIVIAAPAHESANTGNRTTSQRWKKILTNMGHSVRLVNAESAPRDCDVLIAVHAGHSAQHVLRFRREFPQRAVILAIAGTDLYNALRRRRRAQACLETADRVVVLQPLAIAELPKTVRPKCRVIYQSATLPNQKSKPVVDRFQVCVIGHLRPVKDPFRAAMAVRRLPQSSRIQVVHLGAALSPAMQSRAERETAMNPRYKWLGERTWRQTIAQLRRSRLLVHSSKTEGGANVMSESILADVPVLSSHITGSIGLLGEDYAGYFPTGDTQALRSLLLRAESEPDFVSRLQTQIQIRKPLFHPQREEESWRDLLAELASRIAGV